MENILLSKDTEEGVMFAGEHFGIFFIKFIK